MTMTIEGGKIKITGGITSQELAFRVRKFQGLFGTMPLITIMGSWDQGQVLEEGPREGEDGRACAPSPCNRYRPFEPAPGYCWCGWYREEHKSQGITIQVSEPRPVLHVGRLYVRVALEPGQVNVIPERGKDVVVELSLGLGTAPGPGPESAPDERM